MSASKEHWALRRAAAARLDKLGISIYPPIMEPRLTFRNVDGPILYRLDGTFRWLTYRERFLVWVGRHDAWSLEAKDAASPGPRI